MAIVGVSMKSSASAPPSAAHADYITRGGKYERRGGVEVVEHGNMPDFAAESPREFWASADAYERANGRTYTELQVSMPRELSKEAQHELALSFAHEMMGNRHSYSLAIHCPKAADKNDQPHMHLMFSERVTDERTRTLAADQFFKRNGAKKDREAWHGRDVPKQIRERWCQMANAALEREGLSQRLDPRTWADQGRADLAALREPKGVRGREAEIAELRAARRLVLEGDRTDDLVNQVAGVANPQIRKLTAQINEIRAADPRHARVMRLESVLVSAQRGKGTFSTHDLKEATEMVKTIFGPGARPFVADVAENVAPGQSRQIPLAQLCVMTVSRSNNGRSMTYEFKPEPARSDAGQMIEKGLKVALESARADAAKPERTQQRVTRTRSRGRGGYGLGD